MKNYNEKKLASLILCIDFRKAFDSISHIYIQNVLKKFNFGEDFCDWIRLFFSNREGRILMDGHLTEKILLEQGVPQGDIISPYIFIISVEILLTRISGPYGPFILAPAEGCWVSLWSITWVFGLINIQFM